MDVLQWVLENSWKGFGIVSMVASVLIGNKSCLFVVVTYALPLSRKSRKRRPHLSNTLLMATPPTPPTGSRRRAHQVRVYRSSQDALGHITLVTILHNCMLCVLNNWWFFPPICIAEDEMETDEQDDESSQDQELPSENDNSQSEDSAAGDNELENGTGQGNSTKAPPPPPPTPAGHTKRLFTFQFNNMGKTDFSFIKEESRQIRFDEGHLRLSGQRLQKSTTCLKSVLQTKT